MCSNCQNNRPEMPQGERFHDCPVTGITELFPQSACVLCREKSLVSGRTTSAPCTETYKSLTEQQFEDLLRICANNQKRLRGTNDTWAIAASNRNTKRVSDAVLGALGIGGLR